MLTNPTTTKAAAQAVNRHLASDREPSSAAAFVAGKAVMPKVDPYYDPNAFDPYKKIKGQKKAKSTPRRETLAERDARLDAEQMAAGAPLVAALLGLDVKS